MTAVDSASAATIVASAKARGVPVIAYDHPIESKNLSYYVSFDNVRVGELQGEYIAQHYKEYLKGTNANVAMINGGQTDNNALMFRQGVLNKLQPLSIMEPSRRCMTSTLLPGTTIQRGWRWRAS